MRIAFCQMALPQEHRFNLTFHLQALIYTQNANIRLSLHLFEPFKHMSTSFLARIVLVYLSWLQFVLSSQDAWGQDRKTRKDTSSTSANAHQILHVGRKYCAVGNFLKASFWLACLVLRRGQQFRLALFFSGWLKQHSLAAMCPQNWGIPFYCPAPTSTNLCQSQSKKLIHPQTSVWQTTCVKNPSVNDREWYMTMMRARGHGQIHRSLS